MQTTNGPIALVLSQQAYNPSHKFRESPKPNSDRLAFVVQFADWPV